VNRTTRILAIVLAAVIVGGGIYIAYETGFDNGAVAAAMAADNGAGDNGAGDNSETGTVVVPTGGFRGPYGWHGGFGFFPFFPLLFLFLIFGIFRPWRWGGGPGRGWNGGPPHEMMEGRLNEWHRQAHNEGDANRSGS
jgi:hypothetical protein